MDNKCDVQSIIECIIFFHIFFSIFGSIDTFGCVLDFTYNKCFKLYQDYSMKLLFFHNTIRVCLLFRRKKKKKNNTPFLHFVLLFMFIEDILCHYMVSS